MIFLLVASNNSNKKITTNFDNKSARCMVGIVPIYMIYRDYSTPQCSYACVAMVPVDDQLLLFEYKSCAIAVYTLGAHPRMENRKLRGEIATVNTLRHERSSNSLVRFDFKPDTTGQVPCFL